MGGNFPFESSGSDSVGERGKGEKEKERKEKKRKRKESKVRSSTFSLRSIEIRSSVFIGARGKVHLRDERFAQIQESKVFAKIQEVEVSLLLWFFFV